MKDLPGASPVTRPAAGLGYRRHGDLYVHPDHERALQRQGLCSFDALIATPGAAILDKPALAPWRQRVFLQLDGESGSLRCYLKRYRHPPLRVQFARWLRGSESTAATEWRWLLELDARGIPCPSGMAYGVRRRGPWETASLVLATAAPGISLERWMGDRIRDGLPPPWCLRRLAARLAALVARLHAGGLVHRDLYLSHVFVEERCDGDFDLSLIDLQRVLRPQWRWRRWVVKDLAALNYSTPAAAATRADRLRWLRGYLGCRRLDPAGRRLARGIAAKSRRIARHSTKHRLGLTQE